MWQPSGCRDCDSQDKSIILFAALQKKQGGVVGRHQNPQNPISGSRHQKAAAAWRVERIKNIKHWKYNFWLVLNKVFEYLNPNWTCYLEQPSTLVDLSTLLPNKTRRPSDPRQQVNGYTAQRLGCKTSPPLYCVWTKPSDGFRNASSHLLLHKAGSANHPFSVTVY